MLEPVYTEVVVGRAEIREIFEGRRGAQIAGCRVLDGRVVRNGSARVVRGGATIADTTVTSLRHFRDEVTK
jgi:translation initiation factor IF-2